MHSLLHSVLQVFIFFNLTLNMHKLEGITPVFKTPEVKKQKSSSNANLYFCLLNTSSALQDQLQ